MTGPGPSGGEHPGAPPPAGPDRRPAPQAAQRTARTRTVATPPPSATPRKTGVALLSVASNSTLVLLKAVAGMVTGSVALLTEALHSATDLIASIVAYFSVRKSDAPPDAEHPYGHARFEDLAALIEGILILVGSAIIMIEAIGALVSGSEVRRLGFGIVVLAISVIVNIVVSTRLARVAQATSSPALAADAAHLRTDVWTSGGVLVGLVAVQLTGATWLDPVLALIVASLIVRAGIRILLSSSRVLVDEALPAAELDLVRREIAAFSAHGVCGHHALRARRSGARRHLDLHVQFRAGTSLEEAHRTAHRLQDAIRSRLVGADVLIHIEPEDAVRADPIVPATPPEDHPGGRLPRRRG